MASKNESGDAPERMNRSSPAKRTPRVALENASWNAFSTIWSIVISFAIAPILIHNLGTAQYGLFLLVWSITGVMGIVGCGFGEATLRFVAHFHSAGDFAGVRRVFGSTLSFYLFACAVILLILVPFAPEVVARMNVSSSDQTTVSSLLRLSAFSFSLGMIASAFAAVPMALHRYDLSSKIGIAQSVIRSGGYIGLAIAGYGVLYLVAWDIIVSVLVLVLQVVVARKLLPEIHLTPTFSLKGLREIFGYSFSSFLTHVFHSMYRESGKLMLGGSGPSARVAYLGTPESIAYRIYMVIISGSETLMPKFSANRDPAIAQRLVSNATWCVNAATISLLVPLAVLMPDFLRLWINPEFAERSAAVGQMMALSFIAPAAFSPLATYFRGTGRPSFVTLVMAVVGIVTLVGCIALLPSRGLEGAGVAYLLSSIPWLVGLAVGWFYLFGRSALTALLRSAGIPLLVAAAVLPVQYAVKPWFGELSWAMLILLGAAFSFLTGLVIWVIDFLLGGDSPSKFLLEKLLKSRKFGPILRLLTPGRAI